MTARQSRLLLVCAAFAAGLVLCLGAITLIAGTNFSSKVLAPVAIGGPFRLIDQNGKAVTDQDMKGKPFLVFFGFTHCPDVCPTTLFDVSEVLRSLGPDADRAGALFITVDPERDTTTALKDYLDELRPAPARPHRRRRRARRGRQGISRLLQESAARRRRLHHGSHGDRLSDGQGRTLRLAVQPQAQAGRRGGGTAEVLVN